MLGMVPIDGETMVVMVVVLHGGDGGGHTRREGGARVYEQVGDLAHTLDAL